MFTMEMNACIILRCFLHWFVSNRPSVCGCLCAYVAVLCQLVSLVFVIYDHMCVYITSFGTCKIMSNLSVKIVYYIFE